MQQLSISVRRSLAISQKGHIRTFERSCINLLFSFSQGLLKAMNFGIKKAPQTKHLNDFVLNVKLNCIFIFSVINKHCNVLSFNRPVSRKHLNRVIIKL